MSAHRSRVTTGIARPALAFITLAAVGAVPSDAVTTNWNTNSSGFFGAGANWDNGAPDSNDTAVFRRGPFTYTVTFLGGNPATSPPVHYMSDRLIVGNNDVTFSRLFVADYTILSPITAEAGRGIVIGQLGGVVGDIATLTTRFNVSGIAATIGDAVDATGTLNVNLGTFSVTGNSNDHELIVGNHGAGTLNVTQGARLQALGGPQSDVVIGNHSGASGAALVSGAGSTLEVNQRITVGEQGSAELTIADGGSVTLFGSGGAVGNLLNGVGTVTVTDPGSKWIGAMQIGVQGSGALNIENGGSVTSSVAEIASASGATGTATITGSGSNWIIENALEVGHSGMGAMAISAGGVVEAGTASIDSFSIVTITGADSVWDVTGQLIAGVQSDGVVTVQNGGRITSGPVTLGAQVGGNGSATVAGVGAQWNTTSDFTVGGKARGFLLMGDGHVSNANGRIGVDVGSDGGVEVRAGATWTNSTSLNVGEFGIGKLFIEKGGQVSSLFGTVGLNATGFGLVDIKDAGSAWTVTNELAVGVRGMGELRITAGGHVSSEYGRIGVSLSAEDALVTVLGAGSRWTIADNLSIGEDGEGGLSIGPGGSVVAKDVQLGAGSQGFGSILVNGADARLSVSGRLSIGGLFAGVPIAGSAGSVFVGGNVSVAQETFIFPGGGLILQGGTFGAASINFEGSGGLFAWNSGTLHVGIFPGNLTTPNFGVLAPGNSAGSTTILGNYTQTSGGALQIEVGGTSPGGTYDLVNITGNALLGGQLQLAMLGGFQPTAASTFTVLNAAGGLFGVFSNVTSGQRLATVDGMGSFIVNYGVGSAFNPNQIVLSSFQLGADFDEDGDVDGADLARWGDGFGTASSATHMQGDADGDRDVDGADFLAWQRQRGSIATATANAAAVPEPTGGTLLVLAIVLARPFATAYRSRSS